MFCRWPCFQMCCVTWTNICHLDHISNTFTFSSTFLASKFYPKYFCLPLFLSVPGSGDFMLKMCFMSRHLTNCIRHSYFRIVFTSMADYIWIPVCWCWRCYFYHKMSFSRCLARTQWFYPDVCAFSRSIVSRKQRFWWNTSEREKEKKAEAMAATVIAVAVAMATLT